MEDYNHNTKHSMLDYSISADCQSPPTYFNASNVIRRLKIINRENQRKDQLIKKQLQTEVRQTSYRVKTKKFTKTVDLHRIVQQEKAKSKKQFFNETARSIDENQKFASFQEFLKKKRVSNAFLKSKMKLFGNSISDRAKASIERQINQKIAIIDEKKPQTRKSQVDTNSAPCRKQTENIDAEKIRKIKKMTVSHMVLDRLLGIMIENPKYISLKYQNEQLFKSLKEQIITAMINNDRIIEAIEFLDTQIDFNHMNSFTFSWNKLNEIKTTRKPYYLLRLEKKDELSQQINSTLQTLEEIIQNSFEDFKNESKILASMHSQTNRNKMEELRQSLEKCNLMISKPRIQSISTSGRNQKRDNSRVGKSSYYNRYARERSLVCR